MHSFLEACSHDAPLSLTTFCFRNPSQDENIAFRDKGVVNPASRVNIAMKGRWLMAACKATLFRSAAMLPRHVVTLQT
jgi:hypothetical protein